MGNTATARNLQNPVEPQTEPYNPNSHTLKRWQVLNFLISPKPLTLNPNPLNPNS